MNRKELELRIWGKSIALARQQGIISQAEAQFLLDEYMSEVKRKHVDRKASLNFFLPKASNESATLPASRKPPS